MVARINTGKSISKVLNYNEHKVDQKVAELLTASGFIKDAEKLNFHDKINHFKRYTSLNENVVTNTLHVSLNFDPSEKLDNDKLITIAESYMMHIGFQDQPYLVYRHFDTNHPHIHIVSTNIQKDGSRISMHNMGRNQSETARKEIEIEFGLVKAESKKLKDVLKLVPLNAQKLNSGKRSTKAAISNVLGVVIPQYKYGSLAELNAVLSLYNVMADRCSESSDTYKNKGLLYRVLDEKGNKIGTPIKASLFYMKPTLNNLEKKFPENESLKKPHARRLRTAIDYTYMKTKNPLLETIIKGLEREGISTVLRKNKDGVIYGVTYVDHRTKSVFNGSDLGKSYSAKMILERCSQKENQVSLTPDKENKKSIRPEISTLDGLDYLKSKETNATLVGDIINPTRTPDYIPYQLRKSKRRRRKKQFKI